MTSRILIVPLLAGIVLALGTGCRRPRLESRPLTAEETVWAEVVSRHYPGWEAPYYSPALGAPRPDARAVQRRPVRLAPLTPAPQDDARLNRKDDPEFVPAQ